MPLYEYECSACGERFEKLVAASEKDSGGACPECGDPAERIPSGFAVAMPSMCGSGPCPGSCRMK